MGSNHKARMISSALIALFSEYKVILISPNLKNKIYVNECGKHKHFIKKYSNLYSANKEHAKYNFSIITNIFPSNIKITKTSDIGHIADSFMQVLGNTLHPFLAHPFLADYDRKSSIFSLHPKKG